MSIIQSSILGLIQGVTEFLPISSSGHLIIMPKFFGWNDPGLSFTIALHWGTLAGVIGYFYKDWLRLFKNAFAFLNNRNNYNAKSDKTLFLIIVATIPGAIAGYFLEDFAETVFRSPLLTATSLIIAGLILYAADSFGKKHKEIGHITIKAALFIGIAQILAIIPGVSRSGITISAALLLGLNRKESATFSFLLATPIILGAGLIKSPDIINNGINMAFMAGFLSSAVAGFLSIKWLLKYIQNNNYSIFTIYRIILGIIILLTYGDM